MPTNQPSSAPQADAPQPTDDLTAAAVLHDDATDRPAGGGALGTGAGVMGQVGAETPNAPIASDLARDSDAKAEAEARTQAVTNTPAEPGHSSR